MRNERITQLCFVPGCLLVSVQTQFLSRVARVPGRELYPLRPPTLTRPASLHVLTYLPPVSPGFLAFVVSWD